MRLVARVNTERDHTIRQGENAVAKLIADVTTIRNYCVRSVPAHQHRAVNVCSIRSKKTQYKAEALLDVRYAENDSMDHLVKTLKNELHSELNIESIEPCFDECSSSYLRLLLNIADKTSIGFEDGDNDARFLSTYGIKGVVWGANGNGSQHTVHEHVNIASVYELYHILTEFLEKTEQLNSKHSD